MIDRDRILSLVPHQGAMCLWDSVPAWDDGRIVLRSDRHRDRSHPLRHGDRLHAVHLCEYGAQAMAVHGGLRAPAGTAAAAGVLVALRAVALHVDRIDQLAHAIECVAERLADAPGSQQYTFRIHHDGMLLAEGRAAVMLGGMPGASDSA